MNHLATKLIGTWFISDLEIVPNEEGIIVFRTEGICIQFPSSRSLPSFGQTFRLWYSCPMDDTLEFKLSPDGSIWHRTIEWTDYGWIMICDGTHTCDKTIKKYKCRRALPGELPDWYDDMIQKNLMKMSALTDKKSQAEQAAT